MRSYARGREMDNAGFDFHRYRQLLAEADDETKRLALIDLLIKERAKERLEAQRASDRDAMAATNLATVVGAVKFGGQGPFKNVGRTKLVLGQWVKGKKHRYELVIVDNQAAPEIPAGGKLKPMS